MVDRLKCVVVGLGMAVTPHAKSLLDLRDEVDVVAAYSRSPARREAFAKRFDLPTTDDLDRVFSDPTVDYVVLLTPPNARTELVRRCAAASKHILMEKPLERTLAAAEALVEVAAGSGVKLGVVLQHRFRPAAERLAILLNDGVLGEVAAVNVIFPWWRPQSYYDEPGRGTYARDGGGVLISQAIHTLDLMLSLVGPVDHIAAVGGTTPIHRMEAEDYVGAGLRFANGAFGTLMATTSYYPGGPERIELLGTKGTATLASGGLSVQLIDGGEETVGEAHGSGGGADPMDFPHDAHLALHTDFIRAIRSDRDPRVTGREALSVHRFIEDMLAARQ